MDDAEFRRRAMALLTLKRGCCQLCGPKWHAIDCEVTTLVLASPASPAAPAASDVTESLVTMLRSRDVLGRAKYGTTLDRGDLSFDAWMQHLLEELLDAAGYIQAARRERRLADFKSGENRDVKS